MVRRFRPAFAIRLAVLLGGWSFAPLAAALPDAWEPAVRRLLHDLRGARPHRVEVRFERGATTAEATYAWAADATWSLAVRTAGREVTWRRDDRTCALELPDRRVRFHAEGPAPERGGHRALLRSLGEGNRDVRRVVQVLFGTPVFAVLPALRALAVEEGVPHFRVDGFDVHLALRDGAVHEVTVRGGEVDLRLEFLEYRAPAAPPGGWERDVRVPRDELEGLVVRALRRGVEILDEDGYAEPAVDRDDRVGSGRLVVRDGHRILLLGGEPLENGRAHGALLRAEVQRLLASTLDVVGLLHTIERATWFPDVLRDAWRRLAPHVPAGHLEELRGLAEGAQVSFERACLGNVFPELFHCSGFALAGPATRDGVLLHGRVLDYMTEIGLQRHAVLIVQAAPGCAALANVGYAGFVGSVTGINEHGISIGEMGGRGEGLWDGMPMASLVRHALERSATLEEALHTFKQAPRTCEYYYVIADGKARRGVGLAAWPRRLELLAMGTSHPLLPEAVEGAVLLSAGDRYRCLVERVRAAHGRIDTTLALDLMRPGVAMRSNLHDALFVPEALVVFVAHAPLRGSGPAALEPYERIELAPLFTAAKSLATTR